MRLKEKCKDDFEKWLIGNPYDYDEPILSQEMTDFYNLPRSFQYGVFVDFFESEDIRINIHSEIDYIQAYVNYNDLGNHFQFIKEARTAAIKNANEIYNLK